MRSIALLCSVTLLLFAQDAPRFEQYPVKSVYTGPIAAPRLVNPQERRFRTRITEGVRKGYGVSGDSGKERPGPNFAGHFIIVSWGCGTQCAQYAIVDATNGVIYQPPGEKGSSFGSGAFLEFRLRSRLMIVKTDCIWNSPEAENCDRDYYEWSGEKFVYITHHSKSSDAVK